MTPFGHEPSTESLGCTVEERAEEMKDVICISYQKHILEWLGECLKVLNDNNKRLYYSIEQYKNAIEGILNMRENENDKILESILENNENLEIYELIKGWDPKSYIFREIAKRIENQIGVNNEYIEPDGNYVCVKVERAKYNLYYGFDSDKGKNDIALSLWLNGNISKKDKSNIQHKLYNEFNDFIKNFSKDNNWYNLSQKCEEAFGNECFAYVFLFEGKEQMLEKFAENREKFLDNMIGLIRGVKQIVEDLEI